MKIAVLGWGAFGQAIGSLLDYNKVPYTVVDMRRPLTRRVDVVFMAVPTQAIRSALTANRRFIRQETVIVNVAKGIEEETFLLPFQIVQSMGEHTRYYTLIGPSFASEIVDRQPTLLSLGYASKQHVPLIRELLQTPYFRIQSTRGRQALELASALKNVYAISCGYAAGLGFGLNTRAELITLALQEVVELGKAMKLTNGVITAPGIVGDMVLTCSSSESRNFQFGYHLSKSNQTAALKKSKGVVEGLSTSHSIQALCRKYRLELPLATLTSLLIEEGKSGRQRFHNFIQSV